MRILLTALLLSLFSLTAQAQDATASSAQDATASGAQEAQHVAVKLYANATAGVPGQTIRVAIEQTIAPGWHTYWLNPGDSGEAMKIKWDMPSGYKMSDMLWPAPERVPYGPLMNFGYSEYAIMLADLTIPADAKPGDKLNIKGQANVLVCDEICIPETHDVSLNLSIATNAFPDNADLFREAGAQMPQIVDWKTTTEVDANETRVRITLPASNYAFATHLDEISWFPFEWGYVENASEQLATFDPATGTLTLRQKSASERNIDDLHNANYLIRNTDQAFIVSGTISKAAAPVLGEGIKTPTTQKDVTLLMLLAFAFLGGLILNLMPCVFPILSMKALHLVSLPKSERLHAGASGVLYALGIVTMFLILGGALYVIREAGAQLGWGFQLQNPAVVAGLAWLMFVVGLNLAGVFDLRIAFGGEVLLAEKHHPLVTSFLTGVLATLVATPCSAPFMATAVGAAFSQPMHTALLIFTFVGLGLAFPYVMLSAVPALQRILPKPGAWMETFREILAFPMFASAVWLVWVVSQQGGPEAVGWTLGGMVALAFAIWLLERQPTARSTRHVLTLLGLIVGGFTFASLALIVPQKDPALEITIAKNFETFKPSALDKALQETDDPVFVNMTASWCITCLVNEKATLNTPEVHALFDEHNVTYFKGDWTNQDADITAFLQLYGRTGVPIYVFYGARDMQTGERPDAVVLPQILSAQTFKDLLPTQ